MCWRPPSEAEAAEAGFSVSDYLLDAVEVWPENWRAFCLFSRLQTQWHYAGGGMGPLVKTGLVYPSLFALMGRLTLTDDEYDDLLDDVQTLEIAGLNAG